MELIGANTLFHGRLEKNNEPVVVSIPGVLENKYIGKIVGFSYDNSKIHLFDISSDQRIS